MFHSLQSTKISTLVTSTILVALQLCTPAASYTNPSTPTPDNLQEVTSDAFDDDERIIIPPAPGSEDRVALPNGKVFRTDAALPAPVLQMRERLKAAAQSGDVESLRNILQRQTNQPVLAFGEVDDPIVFLKESSNDGEGRELLAIMLELLEAPYSITPAEDGEPAIYVWPAYAAHNLENLSPAELIDVYKIVSHTDLEEMQLYGGWYFFRVGIDAAGEWRYFVAGD